MAPAKNGGIGQPQRMLGLNQKPAISALNREKLPDSIAVR
jgi:hypothetical protein